MLKVFVDSGSSIKQDEKKKWNVELVPLRYSMGENEYTDGVDITIDEFYKKLIDEKLFPKTSLPSLDELEKKVNACTDKGDDVIIITISSGISSTFDTIKQHFAENKKVYVIDSLSCVGGLRLLVEEINRNRDLPTEQIVEKVNALIPRIRIYAIPETLDYLLRGGRLSKKEWLFGSILNVKPVISIINGNVKVVGKKIGIKSAMKYIANELVEHADDTYPIIPSYTYKDNNLKTLIEMTDERCKKAMIEFDNLDPAIACHWGPNAFGFIFIDRHETEPKHRFFNFGKDKEENADTTEKNK